MRQILKTKTLRISAILLALLGLYAIAGFLVAPKIVRSQLLEQIPAAIDATPSVGDIHINPFLFQVTLSNFSLADKRGDKLLGFDRLFIDFQLSSIWHRAYSFVNIDLAAPYVNAVMGTDGELNLLQLQPKVPSQPAPPVDPNAALPRIRIGSFKVSHGLVSYEDHSHPDVFAARLEPINFELSDFTTGVEGGKFTFSGASKQGERIEWHGHVSVQPVESVGEFRVDGLLAHTLWSYLEDRLNFVVNSGKINLNATYRFALHDAVNKGPALQLAMPQATLIDLTVRPKDGAGDWITLPSLTLSGTTVHLVRRQAHVDALTLAGLKVDAWREPDGSINLQKLAVINPPTGAMANPAPNALPSVAVAAPPVAAAAPAAAAAWQFDLGVFELRDAKISVEDRTTKPAAKVALDPLSVKLSGISLDLAKPVTVAFDTRINDSASLTVTGDVTPQPAVADVAVKLKGLNLTAIQPYLSQYTSMTLMSGLLGVDGSVRYGAAAQNPALAFKGDLNVDKIRTVDNDLHEDFVNIDRVDVLGVDYTQAPNRLDIAQVVLRLPYARVIIEQNSALNAKRVLLPPGAVPVLVAAAPAAPVAPVAPVAAQEPAESPRAKAKTKSKPQGAAAPAVAANPLPMSIKKILIKGGTANFTDLSIQPNFTTGIEHIEGSIVDLSSKTESRATIDLKGSVDAFSPVTIAGKLNVLSAVLFTDIGMSFRNIELSVFNPYSGKFAGYNITKGKLTTDLHYKVDGGKLDAQHHIVIDQLEFGDKTTSKDAVSLPIKLAVALLKDRNGVIDLDIPVNGTLDDPQFRVAPIIWKVFVNILEKAVTAPFALLGSLFGGGPDMQFIEFQPGVATLDPAAQDKARAVAKALVERPQLKIDVPIAVADELDKPALAAARFEAELKEAQAAKTSRKKEATLAPAEATAPLEAQARLDLLVVVYTRDLGTEPRYPEAIGGLKAKPDIVAAKSEFLSKAIRDHITIDDSVLQTLGQQRAAAIQQALLTDSQVSTDRVFLVANDKASSKDGSVRLELSLK